MSGSPYDNFNNYILVFCLYGISIIACVLTIGNAIKNKIYQLLMGEFILILLSSEIVFALTRYLPLFKEHKADNFCNNFSINFSLTLSQLLCDNLSLIASLLIIIKIFDALVTNSRFFNSLSKRIAARVSIVVLPLILTSIQIVMIFPFTDVLCYFNCKFRTKLGIFSGVKFSLQLAINLILITIIFCFLKKKKKDMAIKKMRFLYRIWFFPLINILNWGMKVGLIFLDDLPFNSFSSLRGVLFSLSCLLTQSEFTLCCCFEKENNNDNIHDEMSEMITADADDSIL